MVRGFGNFLHCQKQSQYNLCICQGEHQNEEPLKVQLIVSVNADNVHIGHKSQSQYDHDPVVNSALLGTEELKYQVSRVGISIAKYQKKSKSEYSSDDSTKCKHFLLTGKKCNSFIRELLIVLYPVTETDSIGFDNEDY